MNASSFNSALSLGTAMLALSCAPFARGDDEPLHPRGDHPAIVVQRLQQLAGYDYASKFYPHPAGLRLYAAPPRDATDTESTAVAAGQGLAPAGASFAGGVGGTIAATPLRLGTGQRALTSHTASPRL